jgi:hypothetical protein
MRVRGVTGAAVLRENANGLLGKRLSGYREAAEKGHRQLSERHFRTLSQSMIQSMPGAGERSTRIVREFVAIMLHPIGR